MQASRNSTVGGCTVVVGSLTTTLLTLVLLPVIYEWMEIRKEKTQ